jgi:hypothetical protein
MYVNKVALTMLIFSGMPTYCFAETKFSIGGELKVDGYYDSAVNNSAWPRGYDLLNFRSIPLDGSAYAERAGGTKFHARATKLSFESVTPYKNSEIKTYIEGDFLGRVDTGQDTDDDVTTNSYEFRLRQAYVKWDNFLVGQAWSNFVDLKAYPEGLTFSSILGRGFIRQAQLRYTLGLGNGDSLAISLENPDTDFNTGTPAPGSNALEDDGIPDIISTYFKKLDKGHIRASLLFRSLGVDTTTAVTDITDAQSDSAFGWGVGLSSKFYITNDLNVKLNLHGGKGIGRYLLANPYRAATFVDGKLETESAVGGNLMFQYNMTDSIRTNIGYGMHEVDSNPDITVGTVNKKLTSLHANVIWAITPKLEVGTGFTYATREVQNGSKGDLTRVMFMLKRKFKTTI